MNNSEMIHTAATSKQLHSCLFSFTCFKAPHWMAQWTPASTPNPPHPPLPTPHLIPCWSASVLKQLRLPQDRLRYFTERLSNSFPAELLFSAARHDESFILYLFWALDPVVQQLNCFEGKRCRFDIFHFIGLCCFCHCDIIVFAASEDDEVQQASGSWLCWQQYRAETVRWGEINIKF